MTDEIHYSHYRQPRTAEAISDGEFVESCGFVEFVELLELFEFVGFVEFIGFVFA
jgi:hypothetical protein